MRLLLITCLVCLYGTVAKIDRNTKHDKEKRVEATPTQKEKDEVSHLKQFIETLGNKRNEHKAALQSIVDIEDKSKQRMFVEDLMKNIKKLLIDNQDTIVRIGHEADDRFPHDSDTLKESLTKVIENLCFFSDLSLRFPSIVGRIIKKDRKFKSTVIWAFQYVNKTGLLDSDTEKVLHQMAQQLEIVDRDDSFYNPFDKEEAKKQLETNKEKDKKRKETKPKTKKDAKQKKPEAKKVKKEEL